MKVKAVDFIHGIRVANLCELNAVSITGLFGTQETKGIKKLSANKRGSCHILVTFML